MRIRLPKPLPPGGSAAFDFAWKLRIPPDGAPRGGQDGEVFFINYWYPQMAVYDDVNGWQIDQYLGNAEFYMGYGNYDVALTLPAGWLVTSTGTLSNPSEVLSSQTRARLDSASHARGIVRVVTEADRKPGTSTTAGTDGKLTWRFRADSVRDVSWATSSQYLWDATNAAVGDANGDGRPDTTAIHAFYRPELRASHWDESARYSRHSVEFFSRHLLPYPYPHMTAVDGPTSCGGMEYPMMTCIGGQWDTLGLYEVTTHEIGHMWFPMLVGSDEKRYAWMDEGLTQFDQSQAMADFFKGFDDEERNRRNYLGLAEGGDEVELMRHGDRYPSYSAYGVASYYKPATVLVALRGVLGKETFDKALTEYARRWLYKHPIAGRPVPHLRGCLGPGPVLVLAHLVLRDLEAGPGHRHRQSLGATRSTWWSRTGKGSDAGASGGHPDRWTGAGSHHSSDRLARRRESADVAHCAGAGGQEHRDRSQAGFSRHRPKQSGVASVDFRVACLACPDCRANRLPITVKATDTGVEVQRSSGGLATGLLRPHEQSGGLWIGWSGAPEELTAAQRSQLDEQLAAMRLVAVPLTADQVTRYYEGFSNGVLWPLFHYLLDQVPLHVRDWDAYVEVNERFADIVAAAVPGG